MCVYWVSEEEEENDHDVMRGIGERYGKGVYVVRDRISRGDVMGLWPGLLKFQIPKT